MLKKIGIISLSFLLCACSLGVQLKKSMFTIELGKDIYANPTLYLKNATFSSRLKVVSKSVGVDKKNNRFMTSGMDYLVVGEYDFAIVDSIPYYLSERFPCSAISLKCAWQKQMHYTELATDRSLHPI